MAASTYPPRGKGGRKVEGCGRRGGGRWEIKSGEEWAGDGGIKEQN